MIAPIAFSLNASATSATAPAARADSAVADYSRHVAGELAVVRADANRDDPDLVGHRPIEITLDEVAA